MMQMRMVVAAVLALTWAGTQARAEVPPTKQLLGVFVGEAEDVVAAAGAVLEGGAPGRWDGVVAEGGSATA